MTLVLPEFLKDLEFTLDGQHLGLFEASRNDLFFATPWKRHMKGRALRQLRRRIRRDPLESGSRPLRKRT